MDADVLISCLIYIFWCQTQMISVYSRNKGIGLAVPTVLEGTVFLDILHQSQFLPLFSCFNPLLVESSFSISFWILQSDKKKTL